MNPRFLAIRILKIDPLFILSQSDAGTTFFFVWQAEFGMCFGVAPSAYRSVHAAPICRSFESSPWHVVVWKWLLEKHPIARQAFFAIGYRPRPKEPDPIDSPQPS